MSSLLDDLAHGRSSQTRHVNLLELIGHDLTDNQLQKALVKGFGVTFDSVFVEEKLTNFETQLSISLLARYKDQNLERVCPRASV
ncbi:MAG: hypothetical protein HY711_03215 [Candidatus Melainabacteria bacterium]|nr:hypothetical protein [Candidatus Melainabacteria bacterium]